MENEAGSENNHSLVDAIKKKYEGGHSEEEDSFCQIYVPKKGPGAQAHGNFVWFFCYKCVYQKITIFY